MQKKTANPLLHLEDYPYESVPFSEVKPSHFDEAFEVLIKHTQDEIDRIARGGKADFTHTVEALSYAGIPLARVQSILSNLNSAATNEELQAVADRWMPELAAFWNGIYQRADLFEHIRKVYEKKGGLSLNTEQQTLLARTYRQFLHNGALLDEEKRKELISVKRRLSKLALQFQKNLLHDTNAFRLILKDADEIKGLPSDILERARERAREAGKEGWMFSLHYPSYGPFMKYANRRDLRERMYRAFMSRAYHGDAYDNSEIVKEEARLRKRLAELLGYSSYAHWVLTERMAEKPENVMAFLNELYGYARPAAEREFAQLREMAKDDGIDELQAWDTAYYAEQLKRRELSLDDERMKPYFELEAVLKGMFEVARRLYGLQFEPTDEVEVYADGVRVWKVMNEEGSYLALLYGDFYVRPGKRQGAWMTSYKSQFRSQRGRNTRPHVSSRPHISIVTNFARPTGQMPALLTFDEVNTLFHEFGHALHGMLADTTYADLSGTNVYWDFVELPSQIMENWTYEPEVLLMFARHYRTGEVIPSKYIEALRKSRRFMEGLATLRQLGFGYLDMAWHYRLEEVPGDLEIFERRVFEPVRFTSHVRGTLMSTQFGHLFAGGYAAGYYSYKWSERLEADAFSIFQKNGIFDRETARKFRRLLAQGGSRHPVELYKEFAGRPPEIEALIRRAGFTKNR